ncbi:hypothetical protein BV898_01139 [Hypsibius exemplaris]|uniref:ZP domain-containing protein n=1 Tax=Hypsibius exemplaris TaxID=2072580 RepID=A0A1W0XBN5_HYPEX|nr:hypothetical protein BV898_01139 [Hypsibius exemplaris]
MLQVTSLLVVVCLAALGVSGKAVSQHSAGKLICDGAQAEYRVQDIHVYQQAFPSITNLTELARARVAKVQIGSDPNNPACQAQRYPPLSPVSYQNSYAILVPFNQCGFVEETNPQTQEITYTSRASIVAHYPHPPNMPHITRPITINIPLICRTSGLAHLNVSNQQFWPKVIDGPPHNETFGVTLSAKSRTDVLDNFGEFGRTEVHIVTVELDDAFDDNYNILESRCWATPDANRNNPINYPFISPRGCNDVGAGFVEVDRTAQRVLKFTVAEFWFGEAPAGKVIYFHCDINICTKSDPTGHCTPSCTQSRAASTRGGSRLLISNPIEWHTPNVRPRVVIDRDGHPTRLQ